MEEKFGDTIQWPKKRKRKKRKTMVDKKHYTKNYILSNKRVNSRAQDISSSCSTSGMCEKFTCNVYVCSIKTTYILWTPYHELFNSLQTGNEDISRFGSRFPANYSKPYYMMSLLLPGTPIVYYGDELGMGDLMESWKPWLPEQPMRGLMQWDNSTNGAFQGNCTSCSAPWINVNSDYTTINVEVCDLSWLQWVNTK